MVALLYGDTGSNYYLFCAQFPSFEAVWTAIVFQEGGCVVNAWTEEKIYSMNTYYKIYTSKTLEIISLF